MEKLFSGVVRNVVQGKELSAQNGVIKIFLGNQWILFSPALSPKPQGEEDSVICL